MQQQPPPVNRSKARQFVSFDPPYVGKTGAKLVGYEWQWQWSEELDKHDGGLLPKRVSDWDKAARNPETGRSIVHWFHIEGVDGRAAVVSAESAGQSLGVSAGTARTQAHKRVEAFVKAESAQQARATALDAIINFTGWDEQPELHYAPFANDRIRAAVMAGERDSEQFRFLRSASGWAHELKLFVPRDCDDFLARNGMERIVLRGREIRAMWEERADEGVKI